VLLVALTGGIGSGKSSVSSGLAERGAVIVDADAIVRELQAPGAPVFNQMVERWGSGIVGSNGALDRQAVADIVFNDSEELSALNAMVHPAVQAEMVARVDAVASADQDAGTDTVCVLDIPLLLGREDAAKRGAVAVIIVDTPVETAIDRLVQHRGFDRADAEARIANQVDREERLTWADFVVDNSGDLDQLAEEIARCWAWLHTLDH
jgi:dephospho-CoA kinase